MSADRSYSQLVETTLDLDTPANTRSYSQLFEFEIDYTYDPPPPFKPDVIWF